MDNLEAMKLEPDWCDPKTCLAHVVGDVDAVPTVTLRAAWRDLGCSGSGPEAFRQVCYQPRPGDLAMSWPDTDRLPAPGIRAADRRCTTSMDVPVGTLVLTYSRDVFRFKRGKCSVSFTVVAMHREDASKGRLVTCRHRTLRARPVYEVTLPNGEIAFVPRRTRD